MPRAIRVNFIRSFFSLLVFVFNLGCNEKLWHFPRQTPCMQMQKHFQTYFVISYLACSVHRNVQITIYTTKDAKCIKALTLGNNRRQKLETVNSVVSLASKENKQISNKRISNETNSRKSNILNKFNPIEIFWGQVACLGDRWVSKMDQK